MRNPDEISASPTQTFMNARMDQFVMDHKILSLRQRREDRKIGYVTTAKIQRRFGAEIGRGLAFERFMLGMITAQQARSARSHRHATHHRVGSGAPQFFGFRQAEIVVRREIYSGALAKRAQPTPPCELTQIRLKPFMHRLSFCTVE